MNNIRHMCFNEVEHLELFLKDCDFPVRVTGNVINGTIWFKVRSADEKDIFDHVFGEES